MAVEKNTRPGLQARGRGHKGDEMVPQGSALAGLAILASVPFTFLVLLPAMYAVAARMHGWS